MVFLVNDNPFYRLRSNAKPIKEKRDRICKRCPTNISDYHGGALYCHPCAEFIRIRRNRRRELVRRPVSPKSIVAYMTIHLPAELAEVVTKIKQVRKYNIEHDIFGNDEF